MYARHDYTGVSVEIADLDEGFFVRLDLPTGPTDWQRLGSSPILVFGDWCIAAPSLDPDLRPLYPFRLVYAEIPSYPLISPDIPS